MPMRFPDFELSSKQMWDTAHALYLHLVSVSGAKPITEPPLDEVSAPET